MLSININGERTYKLADLGVARLINDGENAFTSLVGTEEYIHPELYRYVKRSISFFIYFLCFLELQFEIIKAMFFEQLCKLELIFHSKSISGHLVSLSINVQLVCQYFLLQFFFYYD